MLTPTPAEAAQALATEFQVSELETRQEFAVWLYGEGDTEEGTVLPQ